MALGNFGFALLFYMVIERFSVLRLLFGLKRRPQVQAQLPNPAPVPRVGGA